MLVEALSYLEDAAALLGLGEELGSTRLVQGALAAEGVVGWDLRYAGLHRDAARSTPRPPSTALPARRCSSPESVISRLVVPVGDPLRMETKRSRNERGQLTSMGGQLDSVLAGCKSHHNQNHHSHSGEALI
jgi:hypothetical protein